jgi:hypothetical protein
MTSDDRIDLAVTIRRPDVLHFLGYPEGREPGDRLSERLGELLARARELVRPRGCYRTLPVEAASDVRLEPMEAERLVVGLVTIGAGIEENASRLARAGDTVGALLLDAIGSAAVEEAADRLGAVITGAEVAAEDHAPALSCRISPGYGRWPIEAQTALFEHLPHAALGVTLRPSLMMEPRKSISFAMWLGSDARPITGLSGCDRCLLTTCRYRRTGENKGAE